MENQIKYVSEKRLMQIKKRMESCDNVFIAEVDGILIKTEEEFVREMDKAFHVPYKGSPLRFGYWNDHLHDLMWIEQKNIVLLIRNYERLLCGDLRLKARIIEQFNDIILPWWEYDVVGHMVGGEPRGFNIYISK